jgi:hypothetical protein
MVGLKGLAARVRRLEPTAGRVERCIGSVERFEADVQAGIEAGRYDPLDMPDVALCVRRWAVAGY